MKNLTILKLAFVGIIMMVAVNLTNAQEDPMPGGFYQHGYNSGGINPSENTDSVTVNSVLQYYVQPDPAISGVSTFNWGITGLGTLGGSTSNIETITYGASAGTGSITVREVAPTTPTCPGTIRTIAFQVIAAPTADFNSTTGSICLSDLLASGISIPMTLGTEVSNGNLNVTYTVYKGATAVQTATTNSNLSEGAAINLVIPAATFATQTAGIYTITITAVTDRISRKPATDAAGVITTSTHTLTVHPVPATGPIFHIPNM